MLLSLHFVTLSFSHVSCKCKSVMGNGFFKGYILYSRTRVWVNKNPSHATRRHGGSAASALDLVHAAMEAAARRRQPKR